MKCLKSTAAIVMIAGLAFAGMACGEDSTTSPGIQQDASGLLDGETAPLSAGMVVPSLIGFTLGEAIRRRLDADRFRTVVLWMFLLMGLNLIRRSLF